MGTLSVRLRLLVLLVLLAGCSSNEVDPPAPDGPTSLQPAASSSPRGTERVTCDLEADSGPVRLGLDLPIAFRSGRAGPRGCTWRTRVEMHDRDYPYTIRVTWSSVVPLTKQTDAAFARAVAGAGTV